MIGSEGLKEKVMKPEKLYRKKKDGLEQVKYFCTNCGRIYDTEEMAELCCTPIICSKCGRVIERVGLAADEYYYENPIRCIDCYVEELDKKLHVISEEEYFDKYNGSPVLANDDDFYSDLEDFKDYYDGDLPDYVRLCEVKKVVPLEIETSVERAMDRMDLDESEAEEVYNGLDELRDYIDEWNKDQVGVYWSVTDTKIKINKETK